MSRDSAIDWKALERHWNCKLTARGRTTAQGAGEAEPIDDNKKPEGRSRNRRVEVTLLVPPAERDREFAASSGALPAPAAPAPAVQGKQ